jgi:hypothetical protein
MSILVAESQRVELVCVAPPIMLHVLSNSLPFAACRVGKSLQVEAIGRREGIFLVLCGTTRPGSTLETKHPSPVIRSGVDEIRRAATYRTNAELG